MATDLQYREGLTDTQKNQLVTRLDRIKGGSAITDTDKQNFNYGLGNSWESYLIPNTLSADDINGSKDITPVNPTNDPTQAFMSGLAGANVQNQAQLTEQQKRLMESQSLYKDAQMMQGVNPDETAYNDRMKQLEEAYQGTMGKGEAYKQQLEKAGVSGAEKQLADLNILMAQQQASFNQGMLDTEGKTMPMRFITGQQAQMQKQYAVTAGNTAMMAQALQGNITMAKQTAMDTVNLEYADREAKLDMQKQMLELNYDKLTRSEKKRADELSFVLAKEEERIAEEKNTKSSLYDLAITAFENGADEATARKIMNSTDIGSAIISAGRFLSDQAMKVSQGVPVKIGTDSKGKDLFWVEGYGAVTGDELLGVVGGGPDDVIFQNYDPDAYNWATSIRDGQSKLSDITGDPDLKTRVVSTLNSLPPSPKAIADAEKMVNSLKSLYDPETGKQHPGMENAVGPAFTGFFTRTWASEPFFGDRSSFLGIANQIVSKKALDELIASKKDGATFGALSDREMDILKSAATKLGTWEIKDKDGKVTGYKTSEKNVQDAITEMITDYEALLKEAQDPLKLNFSQGGSGSPTATLNKVLSYNNGTTGGQCGRFVNKITGLGVGDSYASKMSKMDSTIKFPEPGMVFVSPYKDTGHTGFIVAVNNNGTVTVKDSNYGLDEKISTHTMPISKITGLARV